MRKFKIAVCQMTVGEVKAENLNRAEAMLRKAAEDFRPQILVLPEMFNCPYSNASFQSFAEVYPGASSDMLSRLAQELRVYIVGGSVPEKQEGKIYNTSYVFNPEGHLIARHRKIHLFDIDIEGGISFKESDTLEAGREVTVFETPFCKIGVAICYDMRFPELMRLLAEKGAEVTIVPASFNMTTGPAHWDSLIKIRALDNQLYFVAASPARDLNAAYQAYGHSTIVNPWGEVVAKAGAGEEIVCGEIDLDYVDKIRKRLPLLKHRRKDVYELKEL
jgi:predicted amidohydrolase